MIWANGQTPVGLSAGVDPVLAKKNSCKKTKRQGVDNQPYGHTRYVIG
jgi:hypothetical protein